MADIAGTIGKRACGEGEECGSGTCDGGACTTCGVSQAALERIRDDWREQVQAQIERLQGRVSELESQQKAHAGRLICALMTEIDSLERNVLERDVTTAQAKKKGLEILGVDKKARP